MLVVKGINELSRADRESCL